MKTSSECGNDHVARVLIGMPDLAWLEKQTEEYILDGCIVEGEPLPWGCLDCDARFRRPRRKREPTSRDGAG